MYTVNIERDYTKGYWDYFTVTIDGYTSANFHHPFTIEEVEGAVGQALEMATAYNTPNTVLSLVFDLLFNIPNELHD